MKFKYLSRWNQSEIYCYDGYILYLVVWDDVGFCECSFIATAFEGVEL